MTVLLLDFVVFESSLALKNKLFVSCNGPKKKRVGRSVKKKIFALFFWSKMCVLCMFYVDWELGLGRVKKTLG